MKPFGSKLVGTSNAPHRTNTASHLHPSITFFTSASLSANRQHYRQYRLSYHVKNNYLVLTLLTPGLNMEKQMVTCEKTKRHHIIINKQQNNISPLLVRHCVKAFAMATRGPPYSHFQRTGQRSAEDWRQVARLHPAYWHYSNNNDS